MQFRNRRQGIYPKFDTIIIILIFTKYSFPIITINHKYNCYVTNNNKQMIETKNFKTKSA